MPLEDATDTILMAIVFVSNSLEELVLVDQEAGHYMVAAVEVVGDTLLEEEVVVLPRKEPVIGL